MVTISDTNKDLNGALAGKKSRKAIVGGSKGKNDWTTDERTAALLARVENKIKASHENKALDKVFRGKVPHCCRGDEVCLAETPAAALVDCEDALLARVGSKLTTSDTNKDLNGTVAGKKSRKAIVGGSKGKNDWTTDERT